MRWSGTVGFVKSVEEKPGKFVDKVTEYHRTGTVLKNTWNSTVGKDGPVEDYHVTNRIAVVANPAMMRDYAYARYVTWQGVRWRIASTDMQPPEMVFTLGGLYNA